MATATMTQPTNAEAIYDSVVKPLPASERLRLAGLILNGIPPETVLDEEDEEADLRLIAQASMRYAVESFGEEEEDTDAA